MYGIFTSPTEAVAVESWPEKPEPDRINRMDTLWKKYEADCKQALASGLPFHKDEIEKLRIKIQESDGYNGPGTYQRPIPLLTPYDIGEIETFEDYEERVVHLGFGDVDVFKKPVKYARLKEAGKEQTDFMKEKGTATYTCSPNTFTQSPITFTGKSDEPAKEDQEATKNKLSKEYFAINYHDWCMKIGFPGYVNASNDEKMKKFKVYLSTKNIK